jgi:hypothetical protein
VKIFAGFFMLLLTTSGPVFAQNPNNVATFRIDHYFRSSNEIVSRQLTPLVFGFSRISFTIKPLVVRPGDGKFFSINDSAGSSVGLALDNNAPLQVWAGGVETNINLNLKAGREYDFIAFVKPTGTTVYRLESTGMIKIASTTVPLTPPLGIGVFCQRTCAEFKDIVVKEQ